MLHRALPSHESKGSGLCSACRHVVRRAGVVQAGGSAWPPDGKALARLWSLTPSPGVHPVLPTQALLPSSVCLTGLQKLQCFKITKQNTQLFWDSHRNGNICCALNIRPCRKFSYSGPILKGTEDAQRADAFLPPPVLSEAFLKVQLR